MRAGFNLLAAGIAFSVLLLQPVRADAAKESVLYSFCSQQKCTDGAYPTSELVNANGILYGTTPEGGTPRCSGGCGTVFSLDPKTGVFTTLYSFCRQADCADGADPMSSIEYSAGKLYGTTIDGGSGHCPSGCGTLYAIDPATGSEKIVYAFQGGSDGANPYAQPIVVSGKLYGTTAAGGESHVGTIFSLDRKTGTETVLYSFRYDGEDGNTPESPLTYLGQTFYGTTYDGGGSEAGTLFSFEPVSGVEKVLHAFNGDDGALPDRLSHAYGELYGTTAQGGDHEAGTVFTFVPKHGPETILYSFCAVGDRANRHSRNCADGYEPSGKLRNLEGVIYGTTVGGGEITCASGKGNCGTGFPPKIAGVSHCHERNIYHGCGTVFSVDPSTGAETVLYSFGSQPGDGLFPYGGLVSVNGTFYGTTRAGGANGKGTVFAVTP
ncbi:MAG TPA: choice-of-anchor tandem repeat GloVer-containing protein [Rhizomicrobium sp.]|nr:choice-of-anchor tandem repeat GloVer-containing protein [Rhizomicrobium sp.]